MNCIKHRSLLFIFTFAAVFLSIPATAQEQTAAIQGVVTDTSGAPLPGVTIDAISDTGIRLTSVTDSVGYYRLPSVRPGTYGVTASLAGFAPKTTPRVDVRLGQAPKVDFRLEVARVAESVTVTAEAPLVDVTSSAAQTSIKAETFEKLPRGRGFETVVVQAPSANQSNRNGGISIDGASGAENRYFIDGVDTTNPQTGVQGKDLVTDFVEDVQVKSSGYQAEFGGSTGGVISVITKTGTNEFKGTAGAYYNDRSWGGDVRPVLQLNLAGTGFEQFNPPKDDVTNLDPALTLGGPILKDRLWFYAGYEPRIQDVTRTITFVPAQGGQTQSYDQEFRMDNWVANLSGAAGSKFLYKATFNNSGYETENLLPSVTGRGNPTVSLYAPDDKFENWTFSGYADYVATPQWFLSARGGRFLRDYSQSGISKDVQILFTVGSPSQFPDVPPELIRPQGFSNIPTNSASQKDEYIRDNLNFDASWFPQLAGSHNIKAGIQFDYINNEVLRGQQNYLVTATWNGTCPFCSTRGTYGSAAVYAIQTTGDVKQENTGLFVQDSWTTMNDRLTLNIGVRTEQERIPSYADPGTPTTGKYAINFDYGDKLAPRLGFSYDLFANGRSKVYGSFGTFYDIVKTEMPRGSFGGDKWIYWGFSLDSFDWTKWNQCTNVTNNPAVKPSCPGMTLQGGIDLRHPSNNPELPLIDPNLKPMESEEFTVGFQQEVGRDMAFGFRYVNKQLIRAIEDVGVLVQFPDGTAAEEFFIANPGFGVAQKILAPSCPTCPGMPKAVRDYNGYELEFTKRFTQNWLLHASYLYSTLEGNYSGLANADEAAASGNARTSPNVNRIFDSLFMLFDQEGNEVKGKLGGDRPHQAKLQVAYSFPFGTTIGLNEYFSSGVPTTTEMRFQGAPFFAFNRGDMGRTPNVTQTDLNLQHDFRIGNFAFQLGAIVLNLFDQKEVTNIYPVFSTSSIRLRDLSKCGADLSIAGCGPSANTPLIGGSTVNPAQSAAFFTGVEALRQAERQRHLGAYTLDHRYGQPNVYQDPREVRVFARFIF